MLDLTLMAWLLGEFLLKPMGLISDSGRGVATPIIFEGDINEFDLFIRSGLTCPNVKPMEKHITEAITDRFLRHYALGLALRRQRME